MIYLPNFVRIFYSPIARHYFFVAFEEKHTLNTTLLSKWIGELNKTTIVIISSIEGILSIKKSSESFHFAKEHTGFENISCHTIVDAMF